MSITRIIDYTVEQMNELCLRAYGERARLAVLPADHPLHRLICADGEIVAHLWEDEHTGHHRVLIAPKPVVDEVLGSGIGCRRCNAPDTLRIECDACDGEGWVETGEQQHIGDILAISERECEFCLHGWIGQYCPTCGYSTIFTEFTATS